MCLYTDTCPLSMYTTHRVTLAVDTINTNIAIAMFDISVGHRRMLFLIVNTQLICPVDVWL